MDAPPTPQFLDVPTLLETSQPRPPALRLWQITGMFLLVVTLSTFMSTRGGELAGAVSVLSMLSMFILVSVLGLISWLTIRRARGEQLQLESIEELLRLRRYPDAGIALQGLLSRPTRTPQARLQGLIFLTSVLARYSRFDDAILVQNHILDTTQLDPGTAHGLMVARAMAMLREDHLFDADRAISELRQQVRSAVRTDAEGNPRTPQSLSAGLAMIELYRDVKTGHPAEAIKLFTSNLPSLREQLGQRISDAYVLVAKAYDLLGQETEAKVNYEKATLLAPPAELHRRFPETGSLATKYQPSFAPKEAA